MLTHQTVEKIWLAIRSEALKLENQTPELANFFKKMVLDHPDPETALAYNLASKLATNEVTSRQLTQLFERLLKEDPSIIKAAFEDIKAHDKRDPACKNYLMPFLYFKGFHIIQTQRIAHRLWKNKEYSLSYFLQSRMVEIFNADVHPAVPIGDGLMLDHGTSIVIGETAVIGNNVSLLHGITLGGMGALAVDRHPKIADDVFIGAGAIILGNIQIGQGAKIGAGSIVLKNVPDYATVVGVQAKAIDPKVPQ